MSKVLLTSLISKAEYEHACSIYTMSEICRIYNVSDTGVRKLTKEYGCRPLQLCRKCRRRFSPDGPNATRICSDCAAGKTPQAKLSKASPDHYVRYGQKIAREIENEASRKGVSYADIQKQRTLAMVGRVDIGDIINGG